MVGEDTRGISNGDMTSNFEFMSLLDSGEEESIDSYECGNDQAVFHQRMSEGTENARRSSRKALSANSI